MVTKTLAPVTRGVSAGAVVPSRTVTNVLRDLVIIGISHETHVTVVAASGGTSTLGGKGRRSGTSPGVTLHIATDKTTASSKTDLSTNNVTKGTTSSTATTT